MDKCAPLGWRRYRRPCDECEPVLTTRCIYRGALAECCSFGCPVHGRKWAGRLVECEARGERGPVCDSAPTELWGRLSEMCADEALAAYAFAYDSEFDFWALWANEAYVRSLCLMDDYEVGDAS
jgi:hypothetical protein